MAKKARRTAKRREEERMQPDLHGLAARERPRRRAQPRHHPAARRSVERRLRGGRQQHQGHAGAAARLWPAAVRRGPRAALPHPDRHRRQSERRRGRRHRHRGRLDQARRRRHRQDRQAGDRLRHRRPRRHRHHRQGLATSPRNIVQMGLGAAARGVRHLRALGLDQVRRERHHHRPRLLPDRRQHVRQADPARHLRRVRRDLRDHRRRASRQGARDHARRSARSGTRSGRPTRTTSSRRTRPTTCRTRSRPRATSPAASPPSRRRRSAISRRSAASASYIDVLEPAEAPAQGPGPLLHGHLVGGGRMRDADGGGAAMSCTPSRPARAT